MASDVNVVALVGRLTKDVELRTTAGGTTVATVRLAYTTNRKDGQGNYTDVSNFVDVTLWGATAEAAARYVHKGSQVAVQGRLEYQEWKNDNGDTRSKHVVQADRFEFLGSKSDSGNYDDGTSEAGDGSRPPREKHTNGGGNDASQGGTRSVPAEDNEPIPF